MTIAASTPGIGLPIDPGLMSMLAKFAIMMPPVSVCHQLSWNGTPSVSSPQSTPSASSGSPTLAAKRSSGNDCRFASSGPALTSMRIAVGAVYHTATRCSARMRYQRAASKSSASTTSSAAFVSGAMMPYEVPVTQPGSAVHQKVSSACRSRASLPVA